MRHDLDSEDWMDVEPPHAPWQTLLAWERAEKRRNFWRRMVVCGLWVLMMAAAVWAIVHLGMGD